MESITKAVLKDDRKRGMTLGQLVGLVQQAMHDDLPMGSTLSASVGFRSQIHSVTITPSAVSGE